MTSVTEAAKRLGIDVQALDRAELAELRSDPVLAQQFAKRLVSLAQTVAPQVNWSVEDLRDVLEVAVEGAPNKAPRIVEGRYLRKRVREMCAFCDRYGENFALIVLKLASEPSPGLYSSATDTMIRRLRRTDMIAVYRRRIAILLPRVQHDPSLELANRVRSELDRIVRRKVVLACETLVYPATVATDTQAALDWLEDQLRTDF